MQKLKTSQIDLLKEDIYRLKELRNAEIFAHNYQLGEIQDIADYTGDSLNLSKQAAKSTSNVIVFCGVNFMAETASILCPDKIILLPEIDAGCSLSSSINVNQLRTWKKKHPKAIVVSYVNTSADIKAESDYCCTSTNALEVINSIPADKEILFLPDIFLGTYLETKTKRKLHLWPGECHVHAGIRPSSINLLRKQYPEAEFLIHPECGCLTPSMFYITNGDISSKDTHILSTEGMIRHVNKSNSNCFIVATEVGILHKMKKNNPGRNFLPANPDAICEYMKMITIDKIHRSLSEMIYRVKVPKNTADKARKAIFRMIEIC